MCFFQIARTSAVASALGQYAVYAKSTNDKTKLDNAATYKRGQTGGADKVINQTSVKPTLKP
jgi:hypothetical protein